MVSRHSSEFKIEVVDAVLKKGLSMYQASKNFDVSPTEVLKWVKMYQAHGIEAFEKGNQTYTPEFKLSVLEDVHKNRLSYREAAVKYNIGSHTIIVRWDKAYQEQGLEGLKRKNEPKQSSSSGTAGVKAEKELIRENERLRAEVAYLKKLNALVQEKEKLQSLKKQK